METTPEVLAVKTRRQKQLRLYKEVLDKAKEKIKQGLLNDDGQNTDLQTDKNNIKETDGTHIESEQSTSDQILGQETRLPIVIHKHYPKIDFNYGPETENKEKEPELCHCQNTT